MPLTHENIRLFWKLFVSTYEESSHEESKIRPFPNLCPSTLRKSKLQIHPVNPTNPDIFKIHHEVIKNKVLIKIQNLSFIH